MLRKPRLRKNQPQEGHFLHLQEGPNYNGVAYLGKLCFVLFCFFFEGKNKTICSAKRRRILATKYGAGCGVAS